MCDFHFGGHLRKNIPSGFICLQSQMLYYQSFFHSQNLSFIHTVAFSVINYFDKCIQVVDKSSFFAKSMLRWSSMKE